MMYLWWFDDTPKSRRRADQKVAEALDVYTKRVGVSPTIVLVNPATMEELFEQATKVAAPLTEPMRSDALRINGVVVQQRAHIPASTFWVGETEYIPPKGVLQ